jgi:N-acetylglucosaminyldiphosphoundecaprenol N-acetyl-beta-D-mannosaminyltransferase
MILDISTHIPLRMAFVGSSEKVINDLSAKVTAFYPGCTIAAAISPALYFENNEKENNAVLEELEKGKPDVLFLALNYARGEIWLNKYRNQIGAKLNIGVGAAFDFFTGSKKRSPLFIQKLSLEWAWRLIQEPKRLYRRYLIQGLPLFIKKTIQIILKNDV